ncbi:MAG: nucleoside triphosphate pyrophosphohydrolase [Bauldia sp.]|nr:MAG: nucleoside triphosphate pyrophosphohydrolase [Bauldia sp.]
MQPSRDIGRLIEIMAALRDPATGCPWDVVQNFATIAPYTVEEAHEVADAIARGDLSDLRDELGDLLLQVVYHARMAEEIGAFAFPDVVEAITTKLIRRHPHVFGDEDARAAGAAKGFWEKAKAEEKRARAEGLGGAPGKGLLEDVAPGLPALQRAVKLQAKASTVGFDWNDPRAVLAKLREEIDEIEAELAHAPVDSGRAADEVGDLLFAVANLARHLEIDPDQALRRTNAKFVRRFGAIEAALAAGGRSPAEASLDEMEALWQGAKADEAKAGGG